MKSKCAYPDCSKQTTQGYCQVHRGYRRSRRYNVLIQSARLRGLEVEISFEDYYRLMEAASCHYCDARITLTTGHSLDRIDSSQGYTHTNIVACCLHCNMVKGNHLNATETRQLITELKRLRGTGKQSPWRQKHKKNVDKSGQSL